MRILVTYGSKAGGTAGLAEMVGDGLRSEGCEVDVVPARSTASLHRYDAVVVGGALYAGRWHHDAVRFVKRRTGQLRGMPVWFFSSGPLGDTALERDIEPVGQVRRLMRQVDAAGHQTFGGRLDPEARGFMAKAMAKKLAGDWRDPAEVATWARHIVAALAHVSTEVGETLGPHRLDR